MQVQNNIISGIENAKRRLSSTPEIRRSHVENWKKSGLKMSDYCRQHRLAISSFSAWAKAREPKPDAKPEFKAISIKQSPAISSGTQGNVINKIEVIVDERIKIRLFNMTEVMFVVKLAKELAKCN